MSIKIENGYLITADSQDRCMNGCVITQDGAISYVGPHKYAPDMHVERVIDAKGGIIMPGFINTHTHVPMSLLRGYADDMPLMEWLEKSIWPAEEKLDEAAAYWGSMLAIAEMAAGGVTCFSDMYGFTQQIAKAAHDSGMRALISTGIINTDGQGEKRLQAAEEFFGFISGYPLVSAALGPHAEYTVGVKLMEKVRDAAHRLNARIHMHISETCLEHEQCIERHGKTPIALLEEIGVLELPVMAAHCVWVSDQDISTMAQNGVSVLSCPGSNLKLGSGVARVSKMINTGVNVSCATDGAASNNNLSMMEELTLIALLQKGVMLDPTLIPAQQAVRIATINGAKALGLSGITGSLEAGKQADIIIIDTDGTRYCPKTNLLNHLVYSGSDADVRMTMVNGRIIYENGEIKFGDIDEIKQKAAFFSAQLTGKQ